MMYKRYGDFRASDYIGSWIGIMLLFVFSMICLLFDLYIYAIIPVAYALIWLATIVMPRNERFTLEGNSIIVTKGKVTKNILIPEKITAVISYADVCPPFARRTALGNETHILKDKYAVTILSDLPLDVTIKKLHSNFIRKYTTSTIKACFEEFSYVYSFVCCEELMIRLMYERQCQIIVPQSLLKQLYYLPQGKEVYVDTTC